MLDSDDIVEVALPSDQNYFCGLVATAASMAKYCDKTVTLRINVLDGGIHDETFAEFKKLITAIKPNTVFRRLKIDEKVFASYPAWSGNRMTYARLMLSELLPEVNHVIYCDTDFLWVRDVSELWRQRDDSLILQSSRDGVPQTESKESVWFAQNGYPFDPARYFCAGLSFYNLRLFREEGIVAKVAEFLARHPDVKFADQTAMNVLLGERVRLLPQIWQRFSRDLTNDDLNSGCVIHFAGEVPWRKLGLWVHTITDTMMLWHQFNASVHRISVWKSLRGWYPVTEILRRRLTFYLASVPIVKSLFFGGLYLTGRGVYVKDQFGVWCRRLDWWKI